VGTEAKQGERVMKEREFHGGHYDGEYLKSIVRELRGERGKRGRSGGWEGAGRLKAEGANAVVEKCLRGACCASNELEGRILSVVGVRGRASGSKNAG